MKPGLGARLCQRCGTRVDERRGKFSPYCLSCGQPLDGQRLSLPASGPFSSATPVIRPAGRALPVAIAVVLGLPLVGLTLLLAFVAYRLSASPEAPAATTSATTALPSVEPPASAPATASVPPGKVQRPPGPSPTTPGPTPTQRPTATFHGGDDPPPFVPHAFPRERADARFDQAMTTIPANALPGQRGSDGIERRRSHVRRRRARRDHRATPVRRHARRANASPRVSSGLRNSVWAASVEAGPVPLRRAFTIGS